jgi:hypothetical protein
LLAGAFSISDVIVTEGSTGTVSALFTVTRTAGSGSSTVDYATADGAASAGSDYTSTSGTLTFGPLDTTQTVSVLVNGDTFNELNESFFVNLASATNAVIADAQAVGTITNDDTVATIKSVQRGSASLIVNPLVIILPTAVDPAKAFVLGSSRVDSSSPRNRVTFELTSFTTLTVTGSAANAGLAVEWQVVEFSEGVRVQRGLETFAAGDSVRNVALPTAVSLGKSFVLTSERIDTIPSNRDERWTTLATLTTSANLELSRSETGTALEVAWQVVEFTDTTTTVQSGRTTIGAAATWATATLPRPVDLTQSFLVLTRQGSAGVDGIESQYEVRGQITSPTQLTFDRISSTNSVDVSWFVISMQGATVQSGSNSFTSAGTLVDVPIAAVTTGRTATFVSVRGGNDARTNLEDSAVTSNLTSATNLRLQRIGTGVTADAGWFVVEFPLPKLAFAAGSSRGAESLTPANLAVSLSSPSGETVTVDYTVTAGTATGGGVDYTLVGGTLSFAPGETTKNIVISVVNDALAESNEIIQVTLSNPTKATLNGPTVHTYTIIDNDTNTAPLLDSIGPQTVNEGSLVVRRRARDSHVIGGSSNCTNDTNTAVVTDARGFLIAGQPIRSRPKRERCGSSINGSPAPGRW